MSSNSLTGCSTNGSSVQLPTRVDSLALAYIWCTMLAGTDRPTGPQHARMTLPCRFYSNVAIIMDSSRQHDRSWPRSPVAKERTRAFSEENQGLLCIGPGKRSQNCQTQRYKVRHTQERGNLTCTTLPEWKGGDMALEASIDRKCDVMSHRYTWMSLPLQPAVLSCRVVSCRVVRTPCRATLCKTPVRGHSTGQALKDHAVSGCMRTGGLRALRPSAVSPVANLQSMVQVRA